MVTSEETSLEEAFRGEEIKPQHRDDILAYLRILRLRDEPTYLHSIRVGVLAERIALLANVPGVTPKMLLWAGLLHDIGKTLVPPEVLNKTAGFTDADYAAMEPHVQHGWAMLAKVHDLTACIVVRHHQFGPHPYPAIVPPLPEYLNGRSDMVQAAARMLALADYFDALTHRNNDKFGLPMTSSQRRERYFQDNADKLELIVVLEKAGVLVF